jgi:50S ribosomal protein L16 3-hydroxylase
MSMQSPLASIGIDTFFNEYWQKKPLFIRNAMDVSALPLEANELAGFSCEEEIASRIITGTWEDADFAVEHGPIAEDRYDSIGDRNWTLLVQDLDKFMPEAADFLARFDFLPAWRIDDLMMSFAAQGGSVGPHTDEYDVFLIQMEGKRRWQIAEQFHPELIDGLDIKVLKQFEAEQEWVCEPGDLLYLPPNVAHYGLALEPCMTASVGLRAPSVADLLDDLANHWAEVNQPPRYRDPDLKPSTDPWLMDDQAVERFRDLLNRVVQAPDRDFKTWLGSALSRYRLANALLHDQPVAADDYDPQQAQSLGELLQKYPLVCRQHAARLQWLDLGGEALLCANGETYTTNHAQARRICQSATLDDEDRNDHALVSFLLNSGAFVLSDA